MGAKKSNSNELTITRIYDAPVKAVWDAWADPKQAAQWWGPRGFTITTHGKDLRPGGFWSYTMHGPDGVNYENKTIYHEVVLHSKMVYDHGGNDDRPPLFRVTVTFDEVKGGKTKMVMTMTLPTAEAAQQTKKFVKAAGGNGTWDRLAEFLEKETSGQEKFVINRTFEAPVRTVFNMWEKMYGQIHYQEIIPPQKIVYTQNFADAKGNAARAPFAMTWPMTMKTTVLFAAEGDDETRVTVTWEILGDHTAEELATFIKERGGMTQGWTGSFDKFEEYLARNMVS
ncbi:SRPBCC domain-containing protein [Bdellovibrio sp. HCB274]|uniref:SRPBCC domain-containing protein n=1 Tax=Bdellovibrio sp. HCB274 TaxID=3394361 RepID=UPI0039B437BB